MLCSIPMSMTVHVIYVRGNRLIYSPTHTSPPALYRHYQSRLHIPYSAHQRRIASGFSVRSPRFPQMDSLIFALWSLPIAIHLHRTLTRYLSDIHSWDGSYYDRSKYAEIPAVALSVRVARSQMDPIMSQCVRNTASQHLLLYPGDLAPSWELPERYGRCMAVLMATEAGAYQPR